MTLPRSYVDGFLIEWEAGEYEAQVRSNRQRSRAIKPVIPAPAGAGGGAAKSQAARAQAIRERLQRTIKKVPEVMVKITSSSKGMKQIRAHLDYISRKGQIDIEDQDGLITRGKDELKALKANWRFGGPEEIEETSARRDTINIVFSMPAQTDEVAFKRAVRAFARDAFEGHQYVWAYHTQATDPDPNPPAHPHVHLSVKVGGQERRLNPRKADLQKWREGFSEQLRAHGIEANATSRLARLNKDRGADRTILAVQEKGETLHTAGKTPADGNRTQHARKLEADRVAYYGVLRQTLAQSEDPVDRKLAEDIGTHLVKDHKALDQAKPRPSPGKER